MSEDKRFKTKIKEPRLQQIVSVMIAFGLFLVWLWVVLH